MRARHSFPSGQGREHSAAGGFRAISPPKPATFRMGRPPASVKTGHFKTGEPHPGESRPAEAFGRRHTSSDRIAIGVNTRAGTQHRERAPVFGVMPGAAAAALLGGRRHSMWTAPQAAAAAHRSVQDTEFQGHGSGLRPSSRAQGLGAGLKQSAMRRSPSESTRHDPKR